jgi:hypothetical protein
MPAGAEHQMVDEVDADECRGGRQAAGERQVLEAGCRVAARVGMKDHDGGGAA